MERKILYVIEPPSKWLKFGFKDILEFRELLYFFTWRDIKVRYKQTFLGFAWVMLQPLALMGIMVFIFGTKFKIDSGAISYPVFVLSGLIFWNAFSSSVSSASNSMISQSNIIKKIYFPKVLIPLSGILVTCFDLFITLFLFFIVLFSFGDSLSIVNIFWCVPLAVILEIIAAAGVSFWAAALTVRFRDFKFIIPIALQLMLFATPVIFPLSFFSEEWVKVIFSFNPMVAPIEIFRMLFYHSQWDLLPIMISLGSSILLFVSGVVFFKNTEQSIADII